MTRLTTSLVQGHPGLRIAAAVAGTLVLLLALLAIMRPEMMGIAMLHRLMSAAGL